MASPPPPNSPEPQGEPVADPMSAPSPDPAAAAYLDDSFPSVQGGFPENLTIFGLRDGEGQLAAAAASGLPEGAPTNQGESGPATSGQEPGPLLGAQESGSAMNAPGSAPRVNAQVVAGTSILTPGNPNQVRAVRNRYIEEHSALVDSDTAAWRENFDVILEHLAKEKAAAAAAEPKPPSDPEG